MALPKLNNAPKYELTIPSSGETVRYRPFLVKEEKNLMIAAESKDNKTIFRSLVDTIMTCIDDKVDDKKLTSFDIEYMFLQLRSKSVGESSKIGLRCSECQVGNEITVRLDDIKIDMPDVNKMIKLTDDITVEVDWPTFNDLINSEVTQTENPTTAQAFKLICSCLKTIHTEEERINLSDVTDEELQEFLDSMSSGQFDLIKSFIDQIPKLEHEVEFTCKSCNHENKLIIEGVSNFL